MTDKDQATPEGTDTNTEYKPEYKTLTDHRGRVIGVQWVNAADAPKIHGARHIETEPFAWALPGIGFNYTFEQSRENPWKPDAGAIPLYRAAPPQQGEK